MQDGSHIYHLHVWDTVYSNMEFSEILTCMQMKKEISWKISVEKIQMADKRCECNNMNNSSQHKYKFERLEGRKGAMEWSKPEKKREGKKRSGEIRSENGEKVKSHGWAVMMFNTTTNATGHTRSALNIRLLVAPWIREILQSSWMKAILIVNVTPYLIFHQHNKVVPLFFTISFSDQKFNLLLVIMNKMANSHWQNYFIR